MKMLLSRPAATASQSLPAFRIFEEMAFESDALRQAYQYWDAQRAGRRMPLRSDLRPDGMRAFISHVGLLEVWFTPDDVPHYSARILGSRIEEVFGAREEFSAGALPDEIAARWHLIYDPVVASGTPRRVRSNIAFKGRTWLDGESLVAPLGDGGRPDFLFVAYATLNLR